MKTQLLLKLMSPFFSCLLALSACPKAYASHDHLVRFELARSQPQDLAVNLPASLSQYSSFSNREFKSSENFGREFSPTLKKLFNTPINSILGTELQLLISDSDPFLRMEFGGSQIFQFYDHNFREAIPASRNRIELSNITLPDPQRALDLLNSGDNIELRFYVFDNYLPLSLSQQVKRSEKDSFQNYFNGYLRTIDQNEIVSGWTTLRRRASAYVFSICTRFSEAATSLVLDENSGCWTIPASQYSRRLVLRSGNYLAEVLVNGNITNRFEFELPETSYRDLSIESVYEAKPSEN